MGLDCAEPSLLFERWRERLPVLSGLMARGTWGRMASTIPAITVPAWASMLSSKDPGQLGLYGFHNRTDYTYRPLSIATAASLREPMLGDILTSAGKSVALVGVPPSYPPRPVGGVAVGCFLTPDTDKPFTWPPELSAEIRAEIGEYLVDVPDFRSEDKGRLIANLARMTRQHFALIKKLLAQRAWDFFMFVEIGVDRAHHGLWKFQTPGNPYENAILDYYCLLDRHLGETLSLAGEDAVVWVVSDHGAKAMQGGFCLNEWLIQQNYLVVKKRPSAVTPLDKCEVDWARTWVWGGGGYYGRLFFNVKGREPTGVIAPGEYESFRNQLVAELEAVADHQGLPMGNRTFKPQEIYRACQGVPPDLIVYFGDLGWRAVGSLGHEVLYTFENDIGPDNANHAQEGLFIHMDPCRPGRGEVVESLSIYDLAPSFLRALRLAVPPDMIGKPADFVR
jgi:predicted AlkP superfamily phosphohydrolase/phosphomutase